MNTQKQKTIELSDKEVHEQTKEQLQEHFPMQVNGYECTSAMIIDVLLMASAQGRSIESVCKELKSSVDGETIRLYLNQYFKTEEIDELERKANRTVVAEIPLRLWKQKVEVAIDLHDEPFYGKSPELLKWASRGEAHKGTTRFFRIATAYVIFRGMRVTLAFLFVLPTDSLSEIVAALVRRLSIIGVQVKRLYLDKGFCAIPTLRALEQLALPTVIACPIRGKRGGTRALCQGRKSYATRHTFKSQAHGSYTAPLAVVSTFTSHKRSKRGKPKATWLLFVTLNCSLSPSKVLAAYRKRFGIESSYRCLRQAHAFTTSRNPALRFFLLALAVFLVNSWMRFRYFLCRMPDRQGARLRNQALFQLQRLLSFLIHAIERIYGFVDTVIIARRLARC